MDMASSRFGHHGRPNGTGMLALGYVWAVRQAVNRWRDLDLLRPCRPNNGMEFDKGRVPRIFPTCLSRYWLVVGRRSKIMWREYQRGHYRRH